MANRYPDQGLVVRSKIAEINKVDGPVNVMIGNGSSEVYDNIFRMFITPGDEVIQHTPCFGIYQLRGDADSIARLAHASFEHVADAEFAGDLADIHRAPLVGEARIAGDDREAG